MSQGPQVHQIDFLDLNFTVFSIHATIFLHSLLNSVPTSSTFMPSHSRRSVCVQALGYSAKAHLRYFSYRCIFLRVTSSLESSVCG